MKKAHNDFIELLSLGKIVSALHSMRGHAFSLQGTVWHWEIMLV